MRMGYIPFVGQKEIHDARDARFRTVCCGRRFGKTRCMAAEILDRGGGEAGGDYGWVAPTYTVADRGVEAFRTIAPDFVRIVGRAPVRAEFEGAKGPCRVWFLSADNPDSIRGFGFRGIVMDEAASVDVATWNYVLRPTLAQTLGWAVFISTPAGRNWFYDMFTRGLEKQEGFRSFTYPSIASPYFPTQEWDAAKRTLPEDVFRQEYLAEFLEDSAGVFRGVEGCLLVPDHCWAPGREIPRRVVVGVDIAKHTDWTVCVAMDALTGRCLEMERFNQLDRPLQRERIAAFVKRWNGWLFMDATGIGDPIYDDLCRVLPRIEPFRFTGPAKRELVQGLMVAVEQKRVMWPASWDVLTAEMKRYEYQLGPTGQVSYDAPSGYHDDCVMALALAVRGAARCGCGDGLMCSLGPRSRRLVPGERVLTMV